MIIHHAGRWVYLGIPKTASTTLHRFLPAHGGEPHGDQHETRIPESARDYTVYVSVMNPFRRATALWRMWGKDVAKGAWWTEGYAPELTSSFRAFADTFFKDPAEPDTHPVMEWSMSRWIEHAELEREPHVLHAENLGGELRRAGILESEQDVPVQNKSGNERWWECYDDSLVADVCCWAARDFERFGYPTDLEAAVLAQRRTETLPASPTHRGERLVSWVRAHIGRLRGGRS